jgi:ribonuclease VapC
LIAVDTSALVALAVREADADTFALILSRQECIIGTPTLVELTMVLRGRLVDEPDRFIDDVLKKTSLSPEPFTLEMYHAAREAFARYGKGTGHPARLNFGDCLSYAVAKVRGLPLLYKGEDFARTDIPAALP